MIAIGSIEHGPELERAPVGEGVSILARAFDNHADPSETVVEVVFDIPGSLGQPDFDGFQLARPSARMRYRQVFAAVPPEVLTEPDPTQAMLDLIEQAVVIAIAAPIRGRPPLDSSALLSEIGRVRARLIESGHVVSPSAMPQPRSGSTRPPSVNEAGDDTVSVRVALAVPDADALDRAFDLEAALDIRLRAQGIGSVEGNEIGSGTFDIFLDGSSVAQLKAVIDQTLADAWRGPAEINEV